MRSFFQRENEPQPAVPAASPARPSSPRKEKPASRESTHLARGSKVIGEISGTAELVIDGEVEGQIELKNRVVVGGQGRVDGKIVAASVQVGGKVLGNVRGLERVEVLASGSLEGDVVSPRVVIAEGAFFKGKVEMTDGASAAPAKPKKIAAPPPPAARPADDPTPRKPVAGGPAVGQPKKPEPQRPQTTGKPRL